MTVTPERPETVKPAETTQQRESPKETLSPMERIERATRSQTQVQQQTQVADDSQQAVQEEKKAIRRLKITKTDEELQSQAKGPIEKATTWLAVFLIRLKKQAQKFGWKIIGQPTVSQSASSTTNPAPNDNSDDANQTSSTSLSANSNDQGQTADDLKKTVKVDKLEDVVQH